MRSARIVTWWILAAYNCCAAVESSGISLTGGPSLDGRYLSFADPATGNLALRETASGAVRMLTDNQPGSREFAYFSAISRDSRQVAYAWFNDEGFYDLRVIASDGSDKRILYRNEQAGFVQPCAWSPDGKHILTLFFRRDNISQIALVPAAGGPPRILRSLNWVYPKRMDISPDGRFIVYDTFANGSGGDRTVFLLAVDGAKETKLWDRPGNHLFPLWTPDGKSVVFVSNEDVVLLRVEDGKPSGAARILQRNAGRILPMGITREGHYYYGVRSGAVDVFVTDFVEPGANARRLSLRFPGRNNSPAWSPDGARLAYLSRRGTENFGQEARSIVIRSFAPDEEEELPVKLAHIERVRWSPDGKSLLVSGSDNKGRGGLFAVEVATARLTPILAEAETSFRGFDGVWLGASLLLHIRDGSQLRAGEKVLLEGGALRNLAASPDGKMVALCQGDDIVVMTADGRIVRRVKLPEVNELDWGTRLAAGTPSALWEIPLSDRPPVKLPSPGNRQPGFSLHPDGKRIAVTAGRITSDVRVLKLDLQ